MTDFWETERYKDAHLSKIDLPPEIIEKIVLWIKKDKDMLYFGGNPGIGKSYLSAAYIHSLIEKKQHFRYYSEYTFFSFCREACQKNFDYQYEINRICETKYFILDDICTSRAEKLSDFQKEVLHIFLDVRYNSRLPTLITSNIFSADVGTSVSKKFQSRILSKDNTILDINWIDKRQE